MGSQNLATPSPTANDMTSGSEPTSMLKYEPKSSKEKDADNLMYEYLIGANVNNLLLKYFPCFIETYGHYRYRNESDWAQFQRATPGRQDLNSMLIPYQKNTVNYPESCKYSKTVCVLVQHIKGAASIGDKVIKNPPDFNYIINKL
jgi:hypothetical protein